VKNKFNDITSTVRWILIIAAAIVVAWILLNVIHAIVSIAFTLISVLVFAAILYIVYLIARSAWRNRTT
jgi:hypothetical protein